MPFIAPTLFSVFAIEGIWLPEQITASHPSFVVTELDLSYEILNKRNGAILGSVFSIGHCTAVFVSSDGLFLTNQHCIKNTLNSEAPVLLKDGFHAQSKEAELPLPLSFNIQSNDGSTQTKLNSHLVFVPPNDLAFYGGEKDNWEWPRHSADVAVLRAYISEEQTPADALTPYNPKHYLSIAKAPPVEGDPIFVVGFPSQTRRLYSSMTYYTDVEQVEWELSLQQKWKTKLISNPYSTGTTFEPEKRLQLLHALFQGSNIGELRKEEEAVFENSTVEHLNPALSEISQMEILLTQSEHELLYIQYLRWSCRYLDILITILEDSKNPKILLNKRSLKEEWASLSPSLELSLLLETLSTEPLREPSAEATVLYTELRNSTNMSKPPVSSGTLVRWYLNPKRMSDTPWGEMALFIDSRTEELKGEISRIKKELLILRRQRQESLHPEILFQYLDADKTQRLSFGHIIAPIQESSAFTTTDHLKPTLFNGSDNNKSTRQAVHTNFTSDVDITRGHSGSPTLNKNGELIGLVFDMNSDALLSDWDYQSSGRSIHMDMQYLFWLLEEMDAKALISELNHNQK